MKPVYEFLIGYLRSQFKGEKFEFDKTLIDGAFLSELSFAAKAHALIPAAYSALKISGVSGEISEKFKRSAASAKYYQTVQKYTYSQVSALFDENGIDYIPLKGLILENLYPESLMRTKCDLDILIRPESLKTAAVLLKENGFKFKTSGSHEDVFISPENITLELHFSLIEENRIGKIEKPLTDIFENSVSDQNHRYLMKDEYFYYYHLAHMAKHITTGGCGIRPFADLYILNKSVEFNADKRNALLKSGGLDKFEKGAKELSFSWFDGAPYTDTALDLEDFILNGSIYGSRENQALINQAQHGGKSGAVFSRIFVSAKLLANTYPALKKHKWLLPYYEVKRWVKVLTDRRVGRYVKELKANSAVTEEKRQNVTKLIKELGIDE